MARLAVSSMKAGMEILQAYSPKLAAAIDENEEKTDHYEDILETYLVRLSTKQISEGDSKEAAKLLKIIGDFERIADYAAGLLDSAKIMRDKEMNFTKDARSELNVMFEAVKEILDLSLDGFVNNDVETFLSVEPLE